MTPSDLHRMYHRIVHMLRPAVSSMHTDESGKIGRVQVSHNKLESKTANLMQHVGFASSPPVGSDLMLMNVAGDGSNSVIVASNHQDHRPTTLKPGETMLYDCGDQKQSVHLGSDGTVTITGVKKLQITAPDTYMSGNLHVSGLIQAGSGGSGSQEIVIQGSLIATGEITAKQGPSQITLSGHHHSGVSTPPTPGT